MHGARDAGRGRGNVVTAKAPRANTRTRRISRQLRGRETPRAGRRGSCRRARRREASIARAIAPASAACVAHVVGIPSAAVRCRATYGAARRETRAAQPRRKTATVVRPPRQTVASGEPSAAFQRSSPFRSSRSSGRGRGRLGRSAARLGWPIQRRFPGRRRRRRAGARSGAAGVRIRRGMRSAWRLLCRLFDGVMSRNVDRVVHRSLQRPVSADQVVPSGRGIPAGGVAPPSNTPGILGRRALPSGRRAPESSPDSADTGH